MTPLYFFIPLVCAQVGADDFSLLSSDEFRIRAFLHELSSSLSYASLLENVVQPAVFSLEESGGFSDVDPAKVSIYGDSTLWTRWYLDDFDITHPLFSGAPALHVPFRFISEFSVRHADSPRNPGLTGPVLRTDSAEQAKTRFGATFEIAEVGGLWPLAVPIMNAISGLHPQDRARPPPSERRHAQDTLRVHLSDRGLAGESPIRYAFDFKKGMRHYLEFAPETGVQTDSFDEGYTIASGALRADLGEDQTAYLLAEYRQRDRLFAELYHSRDETADFSSATLIGGLRSGLWSASATLGGYSVSANQPEFTRDLLDSDGEALFPFFPEGHYVGANLGLSWNGPDFYVRASQRLLGFAPSAQRFSHTLYAAGAPYGRIDFESSPTAEAIGEQRFGARHSTTIGPFELLADVHLQGAHAANTSVQNSLLFIDAGLRAQLSLRPAPDWRWFLLASKTPVPITTELAQLLDPAYLNGRSYVGKTLTETTGGSSIDVDPGLTQTNIYGVALGFSHHLTPRWRLDAQGLLKAYHGTYRLEFDDGPLANGRFERGVFFHAPGPTRYRLVNAGGDLPLYFGGHVQLVGMSQERYLLSLSFSAFNVVGRSPFGNGVTANDVGIVNASTANPNADVRGLASLDSDRAFMLRGLFGYRIVDELWGFLQFAHRDGQPFAYFDVHESDRQLAFTYQKHRGSPLHYTRPLLGPRKDFRIDVDLELAYTAQLGGVSVRTSALVANLLDFGNELTEVSGAIGKAERVALEAELPRSIILGLEVIQ